jgi:2-polyprenyl-3-methyl-5-hydroxy-6-metoxy-1,4-benzoquinol methylase
MSAETFGRFSAVPVEKVQEFWNRRPCNVRHSISPIGSREYFEQVRARKYFVEPHIPGFARFDYWKGRRVLEVGCGIGTDTINFALAGAQVVAIDLSERSLEIAASHAQAYGVSDRIRFVHGNVEMLSEVLRPQPYDLIYSFGVIHHTPQPQLALTEMRKFAAPGTTLKLMVYHRYSWRTLGIVLVAGKGQFWRLDELLASFSEAQTGCPVTYSYGRRAARELLEKHGFKVVQCQVEHIFPYRVKDYIQHRYVRQWYFRMMPQPVFHSLERRLGWHLCLTAHA